MKQPPRRLRRSPLLLREGGHHQRPGEARSAVVPERASLRRSWHPLPTGQGATSPPRCMPCGWRASAMDH